MKAITILQWAAVEWVTWVINVVRNRTIIDPRWKTGIFFRRVLKLLIH